MDCHYKIPISTSRAGKLLFAALTLSTLAACQSYERKPLDIKATREAWVARSPVDDSVRAFAAGLEASTPSRSEFDPTDGLTLVEAEVVALVFNPDLRQARLDAGVATAEAKYAGLWDDPVLGIDMERIVKGANGANPWVAGGTVGLTIPLSGRLEAAKTRSNAHARAELDRVAAREWATRAALRELWVEWSAARVRTEVSRDLLTKLRNIADIANRQEQAGSMTRLDSRLFRVELARRDADQIAFDSRLKELELQLCGMLGLAPSAAIECVPAIALTPPQLQNGEINESALFSALEVSNPELTAVRSQYEVAEQSLREEVRKQYPDLQIGAGYGQDQGDDRVLLGIQLPLPLWNRNQQGVATATAERDAARGRFEIAFEHLAMQASIALVRYQSGKSQREVIESTVVPLADEQETDARRVAELGRVEPLLLLESLKTQHDARLRLIDARVAESVGAARLAELIGSVPETKSIAEQPESSPNQHND